MNKNMFDVNSCGSHLIVVRWLVKDCCTLLIRRIKNVTMGRNFCKLHVEPEGQMRAYWVIRGPHCDADATLAVFESC